RACRSRATARCVLVLGDARGAPRPKATAGASWVRGADRRTTNCSAGPRRRSRRASRTAAPSRTRPPVGPDLHTGEIPCEAGVERLELPVVPHREAPDLRWVQAEAVSRGVVRGERPIAAPVPDPSPEV